MRKLIILITALTIILLGACNSESVPSSAIPPVIEEIASRDALAEKSIENGSEALFNAQGGVSIENGIFMFKQGVWKNGEEEIHIDHPGETTLTAIYPAYSSDKTLITHHPYDNDTLQDVLIAQSKFSNETNIQLKFRHLFSRLTVRVHSSKAKSIDAVRITAPKVTQIDSINGTITTAGEHTTLFSKNEAGVYSCMVPSLIDCPLTITFALTSGNEVTRALTHTFVSGHKYECHVNRPGIRTAEDLIDFSRLINGNQAYYGKTLNDFGEKIGDETVYRLLADIELEAEDCNKLELIGDHKDTPFYDTFDGQGHTILYLQIKSNNNYGGLFGHIDTTGCIKNLHLKEAFTTKSSACKYQGGIASNNNGTIMNCSVSGSTLYSLEDGNIGAICSMSSGLIINSQSDNNEIHVAARANGGGIVGSAEKYVLNCYSYNNKFSTNGSGYRAGGIVGISIGSSTLYIENCYTYYNYTTSNWGSAIGRANKASIQYFYRNKGNLYYDKDENTTSSTTGRYDSKFLINSKHISTMLNEWIDSNKYSKYTFRRWKIADDGSACFE